MEQFGNRLRAARKDRGLTLEQLAVGCNTSETVLRNYEKARKSPNVEMFLRICNALEVSPDYLLQDELSFRHYKEKGEIMAAIFSLPPTQYKLLKDIIIAMKRYLPE